MKKFHELLFRFFTGYGFALFIIIIIGFCAYLRISHESDTSKIQISTDQKSLLCDPSISTVAEGNISTFTQNFPVNDLQETICNFDQLFDGTTSDRTLLYNLADKNLEFWTVGRHDIAQYFYQRIVQANPDDALSAYIKTYKFDEQG